MAQLRQDYEQFTSRNIEILAIGPNSLKEFQRYWESEQMPFVGLADFGSRVGRLFLQEFNLLKFGWVPALFVIDLEGRFRYIHYGSSMSDIPTTETVIGVIDSMLAAPK
jgi:peroxiredoxin